MENEKPKNPNGRPPIPIDFEQLDSLCQMHATIREIAFFFKCTDETINNRVKEVTGLTFSAYFKQQSAGGQLALRRRAWQAALEEHDNATLRHLMNQPEDRGGLGHRSTVTNEHQLGDGTWESIVIEAQKRRAESDAKKNNPPSDESL